MTLALLLGVRMVIAKAQMGNHNAVEALTQFANAVVNARLTKLSEKARFGLQNRRFVGFSVLLNKINQDCSKAVVGNKI